MFAALRTAALLNRAAIEKYASVRTNLEDQRQKTQRLRVSSKPTARDCPDVEEALWHMDDPSIVTDRCNQVLQQAMERFDRVEALAKLVERSPVVTNALPPPKAWTEAKPPATATSPIHVDLAPVDPSPEPVASPQADEEVSGRAASPSTRELDHFGSFAASTASADDADGFVIVHSDRRMRAKSRRESVRVAGETGTFV
jgi:hypothetical protein